MPTTLTPNAHLSQAFDQILSRLHGVLDDARTHTRRRSAASTQATRFGGWLRLARGASEGALEAHRVPPGCANTGHQQTRS